MDGFMHGMMGEKLGTVGQHLGSPPLNLPTWKQDFLAKPSASVRKGIAWKFSAPYEDTDTVVLTAPSGKFVDIRFPKQAKLPEEVNEHPSFWAFSGDSEVTFYDATEKQHTVGMPYTAHCKFIHDIDSRGPGVADEGDMFILMNGDCLEMGMMLNPVSGREELYKEYWISAADLSTPNATDDSRTCVVAHAISPVSVKGMAIRLGGRIQGIVTRKQADGSEVIGVERQTRKAAQYDRRVSETISEADHDHWDRDGRSTGHIPSDWLRMPSRKMQETTEHGGVVWQISEVHL